MESLTRLAIQHAYEDAMLRLLIASTVISVVGVIGPFRWKNIDVTKIQQTKGYVR